MTMRSNAWLAVVIMLLIIGFMVAGKHAESRWCGAELCSTQTPA